MPETIKWTDVLTASATAAQAAFVIGGIIVALLQLKQAKQAEKARATEDIFERLNNRDVTEAINRISRQIDPREDQERIAEILSRVETDAERVQCEEDISLLTNLFERVNDQYEHELISRERYVDSYDEITLFVFHALSRAHERFDQPDYGPLMKLARRCRENYAKSGPAVPDLASMSIPNQPPRRFHSQNPVA